MRIFIAAGLLALASTGSAPLSSLAAQQQTAGVGGSLPLPVQVGGRVLARPVSAGSLSQRRYQHQWPGVYFEAAFVGTSVTLRFDDALNSYRLLVDDRRPVPILQPARSARRFDLESGTHRVRLEKVSESPNASGAFLGFFVDRGSRPLRVLPRQRQMEFIGDSSVTGYGAHSAKRTCSADEIRLTTDTQSAYGAIVAKHYNADYQINAVSARGVVRNYAGILPNDTLPQIYPYTFPDKTVPYHWSGWHPQIVFIKLNADFVGDLRPDERWKTMTQVAADYTEALGSFIEHIHRRTPSAAFLLWWFDPQELGDEHTRAVFREAQRRIETHAGAAGVRKIIFLPMRETGLERTACDAHYTLNDQQLLARRIIAAVDEDLPELQTSPSYVGGATRLRPAQISRDPVSPRR